MHIPICPVGYRHDLLSCAGAVLQVKVHRRTENLCHSGRSIHPFAKLGASASVQFAPRLTEVLPPLRSRADLVWRPGPFGHGRCRWPIRIEAPGFGQHRITYGFYVIGPIWFADGVLGESRSLEARYALVKLVRCVAAGAPLLGWAQERDHLAGGSLRGSRCLIGGTDGILGWSRVSNVQSTSHRYTNSDPW